MPSTSAPPPPPLSPRRRRVAALAGATFVLASATSRSSPAGIVAAVSHPRHLPRRPAATSHRRRRKSLSSSSSSSSSSSCPSAAFGLAASPDAFPCRRARRQSPGCGVPGILPPPSPSPSRSLSPWSVRLAISATPPPGEEGVSSIGDGVYEVLSSEAAGTGENDESVEETEKENVHADADSDPPFRLLSRLAVRTLVKSDLKRVECNDGASTGWTAWVDETSASELREALESVTLLLGDDSGVVPTAEEAPLEMDEAPRADLLERRDEVRRWMMWMKMIPAPVAVELSGELRAMMDEFVTDEDLRSIDSARPDLLRRAGLRLHLLPSGTALPRPLRNPTGTMVYGKLLFGGVTRFRQLSGGKYGRPRRAGERTVICGGGGGKVAEEGWLQYGGPERNYEAVDMGPCAFLELILLPTGLVLPPAIGPDGGDSADDDDVGGTTINSGGGWNSSIMFGFRAKSGDGAVAEPSPSDVPSLSEEALSLAGNERNEFLRGSLTSSVGGLRPQVEAIVRRVLDGRAVRGGEAAGIGLEGSIEGEGEGSRPSGGSDGTDLASAMEAAELAALGLSPVRGLLLYGPPGCGKTALARELSKALHARPPKIVAAPELLDRWVGGSEKLVRSLFVDAEEELRSCGGDASKSALHVVVIDEIDAVFRKRSSSSEDSGEVSRASAVNQILAKLDGVEEMPNVLLIGMTNRRELLDEALLRPGRLEVQVEIPLPDRAGRREILQIHFDALRQRGRLSRPLCEAIDGTTAGASSARATNVDSGGEDAAQRWRKRDRVRRALGRARTSMLSLPQRRRLSDLAADEVTGGFSGADLAGLVRCAGSVALSRARQRGDGGVDGLLVTLEDVAEALEEVKQ